MKKILYIIITCSFLPVTFNLFAQQPTQEWVNIYYGPDSSSFGNYIVTDKAGNVYVTGSTFSNTTGADIVTIKYSTSGVQQWLQIFNGTANAEDVATGMVIDDSSNIYITGFSTEAVTGQDFITIKYNSNGARQWAVNYNRTGNLPDGANSIAVDNNGFVYVTGASVIMPNGSDVITIKYNALTGDTIWIKDFHETGIHGNYNDYGIAIAIDKIDNVYVTGYSYANFGSPFDDFLTLKYNSASVFQWSVKYNGPASNIDDANLIRIDTIGNIYVCGSSVGNNNSEDYATIKYDSSGIQQWVQRYTNNGLGGGTPKGFEIDKTGNTYVTGGDNGVNSAIATVKYSNGGSQLWVQRYPGNGYGIIKDKFDNVYVTGNSGLACATLKYNTAGMQQWLALFSPVNTEDLGYAIAIDTAGNIFVTGKNIFVVNNVAKVAFFTVKYSQPLGINQISALIPNTFNLSQNYPNPFNPTTTIKYDLPIASKVNIKIYDILGRLVKELVNETKDAGSYYVSFDGSNIASGIYFYKIEADENNGKKFVNSKKMVLIK